MKRLNFDGKDELDGLVPRIRRRDSTAFRILYQHMADPLASFAYGMLRDRGAAEDAVQQAFLELVVAAPQLRGGGDSLRAWMFRCVRFRCLDEIRRRSRRPETLYEQPPDQTPVADSADHIGDPDLEAALTKLTESQRQVILLRHVVGLSGAETARVMGTNRAAVYAMAARAEASLRRALEAVESSAVATSDPVRARHGQPRRPVRGRQAES